MSNELRAVMLLEKLAEAAYDLHLAVDFYSDPENQYTFSGAHAVKRAYDEVVKIYESLVANGGEL